MMSPLKCASHEIRWSRASNSPSPGEGRTPERPGQTKDNGLDRENGVVG
jgi:hypothetical protein